MGGWRGKGEKVAGRTGSTGEGRGGERRGRSRAGRGGAGGEVGPGGGEGRSRGPAPPREARPPPPAPLTSRSRTPQSRAAAAQSGGRCGPIGVLGARRRGGRCSAGQARGPAALPPKPSRTGRVAGLGPGRRCYWGGHCSADFLFRPRPEDAETPARSTWSPESALAARPALPAADGAGRVSFQKPDLNSPRRPGMQGTFPRPSSSWKPPSAAGPPSLSRRPEPQSVAHQLVLATNTDRFQVRALSPEPLRPPSPGHYPVSSKLVSVSIPHGPLSK